MNKWSDINDRWKATTTYYTNFAFVNKTYSYMIEQLSTDKELERVVLISVKTPSQTIQQVNEYLDELAFLAETAGAQAVKTFTQNLAVADSKTYVGAGKLEEIRKFVEDNDIQIGRAHV